MPCADPIRAEPVLHTGRQPIADDRVMATKGGVGSVSMESQVHSQLTEFIVNNYLFGDRAQLPGDTDSLLQAGIIDSTGILELIEFLEADMGIEVTESETVPENLDSIANLTGFVLRKTSS